VIRRAVDVVVSACALVVCAPFLAAAMLAIRLESKGHPIYRQRRVGRDGAPFDVLKLRTMVAGAEHIGAGLAVNEGDPRITRVGAFLRRTSLDELPQLVNVLRGDMSLIGPRPTVPVQVEQYTPRQRGRLAIKPGLTGWAQVNGRASLPWPERIELDLWYVEHRSLPLDLRILARTVRVLVRGEMSVVGPRPTVQVQVDRYTERQRGRLAVNPGLTGWAQVQGRASLPWGERIELDLWYVEHESLLLDLKILSRTIRTVLHGGGLYKGETGGWRDPPR
jgi:lipopolysaccharide/colanic/teichoic acid biosynthesis glycosyltransferase